MTFDPLDDLELERPPIAGQADMEYESKIEAVPLTARTSQRALNELPLFGGQEQQELFS